MGIKHIKPYFEKRKEKESRLMKRIQNAVMIRSFQPVDVCLAYVPTLMITIYIVVYIVYEIVHGSNFILAGMDFVADNLTVLYSYLLCACTHEKLCKSSCALVKKKKKKFQVNPAIAEGER